MLKGRHGLQESTVGWLVSLTHFLFQCQFLFQPCAQGNVWVCDGHLCDLWISGLLGLWERCSGMIDYTYPICIHTHTHLTCEFMLSQFLLSRGSLHTENSVPGESCGTQHDNEGVEHGDLYVHVYAHVYVCVCVCVSV